MAPSWSSTEPPKSSRIGNTVPSATTVAMADAPVMSFITETEILGKIVWRVSRAGRAKAVERSEAVAARENFILSGGFGCWY